MLWIQQIIKKMFLDFLFVRFDLIHSLRILFGMNGLEVNEDKFKMNSTQCSILKWFLRTKKLFLHSFVEPKDPESPILEFIGHNSQEVPV